MALSELETRRIAKTVEAFIEQRRPAPHIRPRLDLCFRIVGQSVEIFEVRPRRTDGPGEWIENNVAKATFIRSKNIWKVYWQRADLKWHRYPEAPEVGSINQFLALVAEDKYACFFG